MTSLKLWFLLSMLTVLCAITGSVSARQPFDGDPERTRSELEKAAEKGDAEAQYRLGILLQPSDTTSEGRQVALSWLRKAARQGHRLAQYELGLAYAKDGSEDRNLPLAVKWLTRAAEQGHAGAWLALGDLYGEGWVGVLQDIAAARECYQKADEKGNDKIWHSLGDVYRWGRRGVIADWPRSHAFYLKAAKRGDREAQYIVGQFYQHGIGTAMDLPRAVHWYTEAAQQKAYWAEEKLGWLFEHGTGVAKDRQLALAWYKQSEQHGGHCHWHLERLGDPEALKRYPPDPEVPVTKDVEITLESEKAEYDLDDLIVIAIHYRNVGKETYSFTESHSGEFQVPFVVRDEKGRRLPNPYEEPPFTFRAVSFMSSTHVLEPGKTKVIKKTLNQCVHFEKPGTYSVSRGEWVYLGKDGGWKDQKARRSVEGKPLVLKVRAGDSEKRQKDIDRLVKALREDKNFPEGMTSSAEIFGGRLDILRRLVFYNEPKLLPVLLDALEWQVNNGFPENGLRALPDRAAVLKALEERLDHPERYNTLDLLYPYIRLSGMDQWDPTEEPGRLDDWKRVAELTRKVRDKALELLRGDKRYRYGYLVPGLLGGSDDLFLIDYVIRCRPNLDRVRQCSWSLKNVKLGREHIPFLESLLSVKRDWDVADAAILQLVRFDRDRYLPELKTRKDNFSPAVAKFLLEPETD